VEEEKKEQGEPQKDFKCDICNMTFPNEEELRKHAEENHGK
jgi:hypothetical protein